MAVRTKGPVKRHGTRSNGRRGLLGERQVRIRAGRQRVLELRVPTARRRLIRSGRTHVLRAQLWLGGPHPRQYNVRCRRASRHR